MKLYVGTSGYAYKEWKGKFYPKTLSPKLMLPFYAEHFAAVEINSTFYKLPTIDVVKSWAAEVPEDFRFPIKAPQRITHFKRLVDAGDATRELLDVVGVLKSRLGPILFGLPPNFKKDVPRLSAFLKSFKTKARIAFEFRNASWFDEDVFDLLRKRNIALCIAEADDELNVPAIATADWGYLRLRKAKYSPAAIKKWAAFVSKQSWQEAYVFFKHEETGTGPDFAKKFLKASA